jgi:outer membrane protein OmpA-like peptidoglycan-associated protein
MKNTYLVCMLAFFGLGLADLFYLNARILPALWVEEKKETVAQVVPPQTYNPRDNREKIMPEDTRSEDLSESQHQVAVAPPVGDPIVISNDPKAGAMAENIDISPPNTDNIEQARFTDSNVDSNMNAPADISTPLAGVSHSQAKPSQDAKPGKKKQPDLVEKILVYFDSGSFELSSGERQRLLTKLDEIAPVENLSVTIDGHTDQNGAGVFDNQLLSKQRADHIASILAGLGILPKNITAKGFGDTRPLDTADTPKALAKNRRAEIKLFEDKP